MICRLLRDHDGGRVEIAVGDLRHDRTVGDPQAFDADDAAFRIHHARCVVRRAHLAGAGRVVGALHLGADEGVDAGIALHRHARLHLRAPIWREGGLRENLSGQPHAGAHLVPIVRVAHVVECDGWLVAEIRRSQRDRAPALRAHRPDVGLEAVPVCQRFAVVGHRHRQKMKLDVGVRDARPAADEAAGLEMVGRPQPAPGQQPLRADAGLGQQPGVGKQRDRPRAFHLQIEFEMVLQILPDAGQIMHHVDPVPRQLRPRPDARQLEQMRRFDRARRQNHLARGTDFVHPAVLLVGDANRPAPLQQHARHQRPCRHLEIGPLQSRFQIGVCRAPAPPLEHRHVQCAKPLLAEAVEIGRCGIARLLARLDEGGIERIAHVAAAGVQRPVAAAIPVRAMRRCLRLSEIGQHVAIGPAACSASVPAVEIRRIAAHIDHAVDRGRAAQNLAARHMQAAVVQVRLGLRMEPPVVLRRIHRN